MAVAYFCVPPPTVQCPRFVIARRPQADVAISQHPAELQEKFRRNRNCLPEIATGAKRPRNDNSGVHTILTMACTDRQHCAGPGCPLPCNLTTKNACCSCSRRSFYLLRDFVLCSYWRQPAMRLSESDMNCFSFSSKVCGPLGALS